MHKSARAASLISSLSTSTDVSVHIHVVSCPTRYSQSPFLPDLINVCTSKLYSLRFGRSRGPVSGEARRGTPQKKSELPASLPELSVKAAVWASCCCEHAHCTTASSCCADACQKPAARNPAGRVVGRRFLSWKPQLQFCNALWDIHRHVSVATPCYDC